MRRSLLDFAMVTAAVSFIACGDSSAPESHSAPASLQVVSGDEQQGVAGEELPSPVVVRVLDASNNPVPGQVVNFRVVAGGGSVFAGAAVTSTSGLAQERWTLGPTPFETQTLEARAVDPNTGAPLVFATFTAVAEPGSTGLRFQIVQSGYFHSCGLTAEGRAYCWGDNNTGALGNPQIMSQFTLPTAVTGGLTFTRLATGFGHTCALTAAGAAYCWGYNNHGQLGDGATNNTATPVAVTGGLVFEKIYAGGFHTCGLTGSGAAYCWGANDYSTGNNGGQLGDGSMTDRSMPTAVIGGLAFQALALGNGFTCGLTTAGVPYCWGYNDYGTLGKGDQGTGTNAVIPTPVSGDLHFTAISASVMHACGLLADGAAYCWGSNTGGELGNGTLVGSNVPVPVAGGLSFTAIEAGAFHTCALPLSGALTCWGWDDNGYIDSRTFNNGITIHSKVPVPVPGGLTFLTLSEGDLHGCGVAADQVAYCWFYNGYGALGNGTFTGSYQPVAVR